MDKTSSDDSVNQELSRFGLDLETIDYSLRSVRTRYILDSKFSNIPQLKQEISGLEELKKRVAHLVGSFVRSMIWGKRPQKKSSGEIFWTEEKKTDALNTDYGLDAFRSAIDRTIDMLRLLVRLREPLDTRIQYKRRRLEPHTVIILVWITAIQDKPGKKREKYELIVTLLEWLSEHRRKLLLDTIEQERIYQSPEAIRRDYERYMVHPTKEMQVYSELVLSIVDDISPERRALYYDRKWPGSDHE